MQSELNSEFRRSASGLLVPSSRRIERVRAAGMGSIFGPTLNGFKAPIGVWSPATPGSYAFWLDAGYGITDDTMSGGGVSAWLDKAAAIGGGAIGLGLQQTTVARQPAYVSSDAGFDGLAVVSFDKNSSHFMSSVSTSNFGPFSIIFLCGCGDATRLYVRMGSVAQLGSIYMSGSSQGIVSDNVPNYDIVGASALFTAGVSTMRVIEHEWDGTTQKIYVNGVDITDSHPVANSPSSAPKVGTFYLSSYTGTSEYCTAKHAHIFGVAGRKYTNAERTSAYTWLQSIAPSLSLTIP